ncbi:hypothetical protein DFH29DRAFT_973356 [Suillus ampliporus]|nr:hypothetical protein DFH29DRAFT_973356 [Suillus ampliporus]
MRSAARSCYMGTTLFSWASLKSTCAAITSSLSAREWCASVSVTPGNPSYAQAPDLFVPGIAFIPPVLYNLYLSFFLQRFQSTHISAHHEKLARWACYVDPLDIRLCMEQNDIVE